MVWFWITHALGIGVEYIIAAVMVAAGIYLAAVFNLAATNPLAWILRPLHYVGYALVIVGVAYGYGTYREAIGAAKIAAEWKAKNYELQIANLSRDLAAAKLASEFKRKEVDELAAQKRESDDKVIAYADYAAGLSTSLSSCRRATPDDDRRLCSIIGDSAPGCKRSP